MEAARRLDAAPPIKNESPPPRGDGPRFLDRTCETRRTSWLAAATIAPSAKCSLRTGAVTLTET